ncbi:MAG: flagellar motor switch protein FliN [Rickettsiales bacterium]|nr:flagellar motor switch protein FliN [Rickettsiales bacterium]|tara:strand:- start:216 stop:530 length:315 start_codon:yes stop_codon:yes gene_type:complete
MRKPISLSPTEGEAGLDEPQNLDMILDLPLEVSVRLGQTRILIRELLRLDKNSVLELDQGADEPLDIVVNESVLARGEVVDIEGRLGIRITDIVSRKERVETLS